ncbi:MAG: hypothetical protein J6O41_01125 [Clostridia bacterium]|nr:hypothetical protein [Clostridia bacterium]
MENITLGQIGAFLTFLVGFIGAIKYLSNVIKTQLDKALKPINESIKELDISQCKNFLVDFLADVEQGKQLDEVEKERAYEIYDHYTNDLKQNSYIHKRWEELMGGKK